jgi:hypothetical protein
MKSTMKFKAAAISIATVLALAMISLFGITPSRSAASASLTFPVGANKSVIKTFQVPKGASVIGAVNMKNNGDICTVPAKRLTAKVFKPDGSLAIAKEECVIPGQTRQVSFSGQFTGGSDCGEWKVEVTNPNDNATSATATITVDFNVPPLPSATPLPQFGVVQGQTEIRSINIPRSGDLVITADWAPANFPLTFRLRKGDGGQIADSAFGQGGQLKLTYKVTQQDIQTYGVSWKLEVKGSSQGNVQNVKVNRLLIAGCY